MKLLGALIATLILNLCVQAQSASKAVTVPITLDHNRTIIDVYLTLPDGKTKRVRAWVDNGNAELWMTEDLAKQLGLSFNGDAKPALDGKQRAVQMPNSLHIAKVSLLAAAPKSQFPQVCCAATTCCSISPIASSLSARPDRSLSRA
jgi:hypothetical protein